MNFKMRFFTAVVLIMALPQLFDLRSGNYGCTASSHISWLKRTISSPKLSSHNSIYPELPLADVNPYTNDTYSSVAKQPFGFMNGSYWEKYIRDVDSKKWYYANHTIHGSKKSVSKNTLINYDSLIQRETNVKTKVFKRHADSQKAIKSEKLYKRIKREKKKARRKKLQKLKQKQDRKERKTERRRNRKLSHFIELEESRGNTIERKNGDKFIDCCPSQEVVRRSTVGKDRNNHAVAIKPITNLFYEVECLHGVEGNECTFPPRMARNDYNTECVQKYSFTQAHVRSFDGDGEWRIDYIKVKSGCSCEIRVDPKRNRKEF